MMYVVCMYLYIVTKPVNNIRNLWPSLKENAFLTLTTLYAVSLAELPAAQRAEVEAGVLLWSVSALTADVMDEVVNF